MGIFIRTVPNVMQHFGCSADTAQRYIDLRDEGYGREQAALMAGLSDPPESLPQQEREVVMACPEPPPECETEAEKLAFAFGWWKAMEAKRTDGVKGLGDGR